MSGDFYFGLLCGLMVAMQVESMQGHQLIGIALGLLAILSGVRAILKLP